MWRRTACLAMVMLFLGPMLFALVGTQRAAAQGGEIIVAVDETLRWVSGERYLDGRVNVYGKLIVKDYALHYNITKSGDASIYVWPTGLVTFDNVTLLPDNLSAYFFFKVEGRFVATGSNISHLSGSFSTGGGIKCVGGKVELYDTRVGECESMGVHVEGDAGTALLQNCTIERGLYGALVKDGGTLTARNTTIEGFTKMGITVSNATATVVDCTIQSMTDSNESLGIGARGAQLDITGTEIAHCRADGLQLVEGTRGQIADCEIHNCLVGIRMDAMRGNLTVLDCNIHDCLDGLNLYDTNGIVVERCALVSDVNGISSKDCHGTGYTLRNDVIANNSQLGAYVVGDGFHEEGTIWTDSLGHTNALYRVKQLWTLDVNVSTSERPIQGAEVVVSTPNGTIAFNYTTDSFGSVTNGIVLEGYHVQNDGTKVVDEGYKLSVTYGLSHAQKTVDMDRDKTITVILGEVQKVSPLRTPLGYAVIALIILAVICGAAYWYLRVR